MRRAAFVALLLLAACGRSAGEPVQAPITETVTTETTNEPADSPTTSTPTTVPGTITVPPLQGLVLTEVLLGLDFPIMATAPTGDSSLFVALKGGVVLAVDGGVQSTVLDISDRVRDSGEQGLLGMAFAPTFPSDPRLYVHYSNESGDNVLSSFLFDGGVADPRSEVVLLTVGQPAPNHNGGMIQFGPDGYLYVGLGDGGGANDLFNNGQDPESELGTVLRLEPTADGHRSAPGNLYGDVWAFGLRNPWRFWIDDEARTVTIADVGQNTYEEINVSSIDRNDLNFGWPISEGLHCFSPSEGCDVTGVELPVLEVSHGDAGTCSITGGVVYRGSAIPELHGAYLYSDYCGGYLRAVGYETEDLTDMIGGRIGSVASFGVDGAGEVYLLTAEGSVYRLEPVR